MASDTGDTSKDQGTGGGDEPPFPDEVVNWVTENPEHVQKWMNDKDFRRDLLRDPESYGLTGDAGAWVKQRVQHKGIERLVGDQPGHIVAM